MGRLDGKVVFITGGGRGQGRSHAVTLASEGADVVVTDICEPIPEIEHEYLPSTQADLDETVRLVHDLDRRCLGVKADARSAEQMQAAVDQAIAEFGRIDTLAVNHGMYSTNPWDQVTHDQWDVVIECDLNAVWRCARPAIPHMVEQGGGSIVFTSSSAALRPSNGFAHYIAAKAGVIGLMNALAAELAPHSIRVNVICPGMTDTPMVFSQGTLERWSGKKNATREDVVFPSQSMGLLPVPWLDPIDISNALTFLASDESRYITGVTLPVDAGYTMQPPGIPPIASEKLWRLEHSGETP